MGAQIDIAIGRLAGQQEGLVSRRQLLRLAIGRRAIQHRLAVGRLIAVRRGVYAVGHRGLTRNSRWLAAVLAVGEGAALSHRSAAALRRLPVAERRIELTAPGRRRARGVIVHVSAVSGDELETVAGIRTTTIARTLLDLAATLTPHQLRRAVNESEYLGLTDPVGLPRLLERHPRRPGVTALRAIIADLSLGVNVDESELEAGFRAFLTDHALPEPLWRPTIAGVRPDCVWPGRRLIVELDGRAAHATRRRFETDRDRDRRLALLGWTVVRVTWRMLERDRERLDADLRTLLLD